MQKIFLVEENCIKAIIATQIEDDKKLISFSKTKLSQITNIHTSKTSMNL